MDVEKLAKEMAGEAGVVISREYKFMCSDPGQEQIKKDIAEFGLNRVVVAACSPRMHEPTFRRACARGRSQSLPHAMANIREQCSWVTDRDARNHQGKTLVIVRAHRSARALDGPLQPAGARSSPARSSLAEA